MPISTAPKEPPPLKDKTLNVANDIEQIDNKLNKIYFILY
jgi:hypothetical protein